VISLKLDVSAGRVLVLGAHCDDVEIGCFGTLWALLSSRPGLHLHVVLFASDDNRRAESEKAISRLERQCASLVFETHEFRDGFFPSQWAEIKDGFEQLKSRVQPDVIFTHSFGDAHQDHRIVSELTRNTFRNHLVLEYEIPKVDGDLGHPGVYVPLTMETVERKIQTLMDCYPSQRSRAWFTEDLFLGLMRLRGMECASPSGYAEAFHSRKSVVTF
jgi:LmbE family N-acetylglucosaminyl deacetylase